MAIRSSSHVPMMYSVQKEYGLPHQRARWCAMTFCNRERTMSLRNAIFSHKLYEVLYTISFKIESRT